MATTISAATISTTRSSNTCLSTSRSSTAWMSPTGRRRWRASCAAQRRPRSGCPTTRTLALQESSYAGNWVTASGSGGGLCWRLLDLDAVAEPDTLDDLRQLVLALEVVP